MRHRPVLRPWFVIAALLGLGLAQCSTTAAVPDAAARAQGLGAFATVHAVLLHPRCVNCHPAGDAPLVGDAGEVHPQLVQRGSDGMGLYAMTCPACHRGENAEGPHMPPGAPRWHMPSRRTPLVFEGRSAADLARQLTDREQNGGLSPQQLLQHVTTDPLVLWGWQPGVGRTPVPVPHAEFVAAFRAWVDGGCPVPE